MVAVEVEGVACCVEVVDDDLDDVAVGDDEGVDLAVDDGVGVVGACCGGGVEGWYLLADIGFVVEACTEGRGLVDGERDGEGLGGGGGGRTEDNRWCRGKTQSRVRSSDCRGPRHLDRRWV